MMSLIIPYLFF